jgi:hypothetical protein
MTSNDEMLSDVCCEAAPWYNDAFRTWKRKVEGIRSEEKKRKIRHAMPSKSFPQNAVPDERIVKKDLPIASPEVLCAVVYANVKTFNDESSTTCRSSAQLTAASVLDPDSGDPSSLLC